MATLKMRVTECGVLTYFLAWILTLWMWLNPVYLTPSPWLAGAAAFFGMVGLIFTVSMIGKKRREARNNGRLFPWYASPSFALGMIFVVLEVMTFTPVLRYIIFPLKNAIIVIDIVVISCGSAFVFFGILAWIHRHAGSNT